MNDISLPEGVKIKTVAELTREIKGALEERFPSVWVSGQISNYRPASSGHVYLTLKDAEAQLPGVIWKTVAGRLKFEPHDGLEVIARGHIEVYPPHGKYQLIIEELQPKGLGALELAFRQLCEKLSKLGYFEPARKKPLPKFPRRLALVTSPTSAAVRDMLKILSSRWPALEVWVCPVRVQGEGAGAEIASAIRLLNRLHDSRLTSIDVMIVGRGGGSMEDLWAFNEEGVARAIFESRIPIISAVGHEIDVTVADLVADCRAATPTQAAALVVPDRLEILGGLQALHVRYQDLTNNRLALARRFLDELANSRVLRFPLERIRTHEQRLDDWSDRLGRIMQHRMERSGERVQAFAARLVTLSPLNVLGRGYSLTRRENREIVRSADQVSVGDRLLTLFRSGRITSRVEEISRDVSANDGMTEASRHSVNQRSFDGSAQPVGSHERNPLGESDL
jgi:exodeoxyribonuclease VII large subunit